MPLGSHGVGIDWLHVIAVGLPGTDVLVETANVVARHSDGVGAVLVTDVLAFDLDLTYYLDALITSFILT